MRRFPLTVGNAGGAGWRQTLSVPPAAAAGGSATLQLVELYCIALVPTPDYCLRVFAVLGAAANDVVTWSFSGAEADHILGGTEQITSSVALLAVSGGGGTIQAQINGNTVGTLPYAGNVDETCLPEYPP